MLALPDDMIYYILEFCDPKTYLTFITVYPSMKTKTLYRIKKQQRKEHIFCKYYYSDHALQRKVNSLHMFRSPRCDMKLKELEFLNTLMKRVKNEAKMKRLEKNIVLMFVVGAKYIIEKYLQPLTIE